MRGRRARTDTHRGGAICVHAGRAGGTGVLHALCEHDGGREDVRHGGLEAFAIQGLQGLVQHLLRERAVWQQAQRLPYAVHENIAPITAISNNNQQTTTTAAPEKGGAA